MDSLSVVRHVFKALVFIGDLTIFAVRSMILTPLRILYGLYFIGKVLLEILLKYILKSFEIYSKTRRLILVKATTLSFPALKFPALRIPTPRLPSIKFPDFRLISPKKSVRIPDEKKVKKIKIFPFSTFWVKVRYFILGFIFAATFIFLPLLFWIFIQDLPSPHILSQRESAQTTKIYDRNGKLLYQIYANQNRTIVPLSSIPRNLQKAAIAIEDKDFYSNPGFDIQAIIRSAIADLSGKPIQGGSTITQQLVKTSLLTSEISLTRKAKEIVVALWAEKIYTKDQILEMYLNEIPYGGTAWGIEAASQTYFGKSAKDLTLSESAFLAGLPNAPTIYSPFGENPNLWKQRQREVLRKMVEEKYISSREEQEALKVELSFKSQPDPLHAPHFVMFVKDWLIKKYGIAMVERGGLNVKTSLDLETQETVEKILKNQVDSFSYLHLTNGASIVSDPKNGDILAMVGSREYADSNGGNFNVTTGLRQPGSSIKVITYATGLLKGFTAATTLEDKPINFRSEDGGPSYAPVNYDARFHGTMTLRNALGNSVNIPAVKLLNAVGVPSMVDLAKNMGITSWGEPSDYGLAITLGAADVKMVDMAAVYGTLANQGKKVDLNPIIEVVDGKGNVLEKKQVEEKAAMDPGAAFIISDILADNQARSMAFGSSSPLVIPGKTVSVKTGTSDNKRDNWTIGYTPSYVVAVWVGNNDNTPMDPRLTSGITGAAPIWHEVMTSLLNGKDDEKQSIPSEVVQKFCAGRNEYFIKGTENFVNCDFRRFPISPSP